MRRSGQPSRWPERGRGLRGRSVTTSCRHGWRWMRVRCTRASHPPLRGSLTGRPACRCSIPRRCVRALITADRYVAGEAGRHAQVVENRGMATKSHWGLTPRESIEAECARRGTSELVKGCVRLVRGQDVDAALVMALGGPAAGKFLDGRPHPDRYWLQVWGLRGLFWAWEESATPAVQAALADESWRVREMAARVVGKRSIGEASTVVQLRADPVLRVRIAAERAVRLPDSSRCMRVRPGPLARPPSAAIRALAARQVLDRRRHLSPKSP